jgi:hypothetical protein
MYNVNDGKRMVARLTLMLRMYLHFFHTYFCSVWQKLRSWRFILLFHNFCNGYNDNTWYYYRYRNHFGTISIIMGSPFLSQYPRDNDLSMMLIFDEQCINGINKGDFSERYHFLTDHAKPSTKHKIMQTMDQ